jgi:YD repeat-containing protein
MKSFLPFALAALAFLSRPLLADDVQIGTVTAQINTSQTGFPSGYTSYDAQSQLTQSTDPDGNVTTYVYDANTTTTDPGQVTTYQYDALDHVQATTDPSSHVTTYQYDPSGTDARDHSVTYQYDPGYSSNPDSTQTEPPVSGATTYQYDADNRETDQTDALGHLTRYEYDLENRGPTGISGSDALGNLIRYEYDPDDRTIQSTDALRDSTTTTYDAEGNVAVEFTAPRTTTTLYDAEGNVVTTEGASTLTITLSDETTNTTVFSYNTFGDAIETTGTLTPGDTYLFQYQYDLNGSLTGDAAGTASVSLALPEPTSLSLLAFGTLMLTARRKSTPA